MAGPCSLSSGCPYRKRMDDWFAGSGEMSDRIIEMSSYNAMLGCAVAGHGDFDGAADRPQDVPRREAAQRSCHAAGVQSAPTVFIRRKGPVSPKVSALIEVLMKQRDIRGRPRKNGRDADAQALADRGARATRAKAGEIAAPPRTRPRSPSFKSSDCIRRPRDGCAARHRAP